MRRLRGGIGFSVLVASVVLAAGQGQQTGEQISAQARNLHTRALVLDTHADTPQRLIYDEKFNIARRDPEGHVDIPRMREGGLDAVFFSIWVSSDVTGPEAVKRAVDLIDSVHEAVRTNPQYLALATTSAEVRRAHQQGKIAALMGMEGGHMIDDDLGVLRMYAALGVRYLTLTHFLNNNWADSSTDTPKHNGLTDFGKEVVRELNHQGVIVDISHVSDKTFFDVLEVTRAPVIASHSSCRAIAAHERNMTDEMLRALAKNGGVIHINYHLPFISQEFLEAGQARGRTLLRDFKEVQAECGGNQACAIKKRERADREDIAAGRMPKVSWGKIVEHIDHVVKLVGPDHVGLGSDFDGASMPEGMEDASKLMRITQALLRKGYAEADVEKILGGSTLRVMEQVERVSKEMKALKQ